MVDFGKGARIGTWPLFMKGFWCLFFDPDACGLIRWMLMVNPERRATIEDIASHWWVNWGYKVPIGEQESLRDNESPLATVAEWLRRSSRPLFENGSKVRCFFKHHIPGVTLERQRSLKKSKKENDISHALQETSLIPENPSKSILKRPKGILKKRNSCEKAQVLPTQLIATPVDMRKNDDGAGSMVDLACVLSSRALACKAESVVATPLVPKKGILKKPQKRESGYYSSPERSESGDVLDSKNLDLDASVFVGSPSPTQSPLGHAARRKGILKHNGKYSSSSTESDSVPAKVFSSFTEVALPRLSLASRVHPSSAVSEDSILSTESFDQLDLPDRMPGNRGAPMRGSVSVDDLLQLDVAEAETGRRLRRWTVTRCQSPLADSCFSLADCENVTEVYKRAVTISMKLS